MRLGILGGTFNPPHLGHLVCASEAYLQLELHRLMLVPVRKAPHKPIDEEPGVEHRLAMSRLAVAGDEDRMEVSELEALREGTSYTVDTLEELHSSMPDSQLFLIVGGDVAASFGSWREPERVLSLAQLAVAARPGTARERVQSTLGALEGGGGVRFVEMPEVEISSTMLRDRIRAGKATKYLMPDAVRAYADEHRLYRGKQSK